MPEYTESVSFDLKICRDEITQIAKIFVISEARGHDAIPSILYVRTAGTLIISFYNVYRNFVRSSQFLMKMEGRKRYSIFQEMFADKSQKLSLNKFVKHW